MISINKIWKFLNTNFGLLIMGFILTTILGSYFSARFQEELNRKRLEFEVRRQNYEWERDRKFEILKRKLDEGQKSLEEISDLINMRFFRLDRVFTNIYYGDLQNARKNWKLYMDVVERWNVKLIIMQSKLERLVSKQVALEFNNYETDKADLDNPISVHGKFFLAHNKVLELLECMKQPDCSVSKNQIRSTNAILRDLDFHTDFFIDRISDLFLEKGYELENFQLKSNDRIDG